MSVRGKKLEKVGKSWGVLGAKWGRFGVKLGTFGVKNGGHFQECAQPILPRLPILTGPKDSPRRCGAGFAHRAMPCQGARRRQGFFDGIYRIDRILKKRREEGVTTDGHGLSNDLNSCRVAELKSGLDWRKRRQIMGASGKTVADGSWEAVVG